MKEQQIDKRLLVLLYILAFFLVIEWLKPISSLTDTGHISHFYGFVVLCFLLGLLRISGWIGVPVKIVYIILSIQYIFNAADFLSLEALKVLFAELTFNASLLWSGEWMDVTFVFRTILFFVLIWMVTYLLRFWMEYRKSIFLFFGMTVLFLAVVDTFTEYDASYPILRVMVIGFFLLGILFPIRLTAATKIDIPLWQVLKVVVPLSAVLLIVVIVSILIPIKEPVWQDPVPYIKSATGFGNNGDSSGSGISKVGYGLDDTQLGGSFAEDDTLVFQAYVDSRQYWKMETKNTYTTKGWVQESELYVDVPVRMSGVIGGQVVEPPREVAEIALSEQLPLVPYPYGFEELQTEVEGVVYHIDEQSGQMGIFSNVALEGTYRSEFVEPDYSLKALRETKIADLQYVRSEMQEFLQIPEETPDRVSKLAIELTNNEESLYEKAKIIERYFGRNGFVYSREDVATPKEDEDYVDQFLFETKQGYCDNFSTSMVMMLRSVDIPARWVKGFAPGDQKRDGNETYYEVTNNQAHSWVEAFMPGIGWMPFEPTIGFNGASNVNYDIESEEEDLKDQEELRQNEDEKKKEQEEQVAKKNKASSSGLLKFIPDWLRSGLAISIIVGLLIAGILGVVFKTRKKWIPRILVKANRQRPETFDTLAMQYEQLLKQFYRIGIVKPAGMTLTVFAKQVDRLRGDQAMSDFTAAYEEGLYGQGETEQDWQALREMWEDLIIDTTG